MEDNRNVIFYNIYYNYNNIIFCSPSATYNMDDNRNVRLWDAEREKLAATKSLQAEETWEAWCSKFRCNSVTVTPHYSGVTVVTVLQCYSNTSLEERRAAWEGREINQKSPTGDSSESHTAPISFFQGFVILTCLELYKVVLVSFSHLSHWL